MIYRLVINPDLTSPGNYDCVYDSIEAVSKVLFSWILPRMCLSSTWQFATVANPKDTKTTTRDNYEHQVVTTLGGKYIIAHIYRAHRLSTLNAIPNPFKETKSTQTNVESTVRTAEQTDWRPSGGRKTQRNAEPQNLVGKSRSGKQKPARGVSGLREVGKNQRGRKRPPSSRKPTKH